MSSGTSPDYVDELLAAAVRVTIPRYKAKIHRVLARVWGTTS